jgi:hypothetical protein
MCGEETQGGLACGDSAEGREGAMEQLLMEVRAGDEVVGW